MIINPLNNFDFQKFYLIKNKLKFLDDYADKETKGQEQEIVQEVKQVLEVEKEIIKTVEIEMPETKMVEFLTSTKKETELNFTPEQVQDIFTKNLKEVFSKINISEIVEDRIKMAKGIIEFE